MRATSTPGARRKIPGDAGEARASDIFLRVYVHGGRNLVELLLHLFDRHDFDLHQPFDDGIREVGASGTLSGVPAENSCGQDEKIIPISRSFP